MAKKLSDIEWRLLQITRHFLEEIKAGQASRALSLEASLDRDLGLGSLERVELSRRIETEFSMQFSVNQLANISSLRDFIPLLKQGSRLVLSEIKEFSQPLSEFSIDPRNVSTLTDLLAQYAHAEPDRPHIYFQDEEGNEQIISYGELFQTAGRIAQALADHKLKPGETVAIMLSASHDYFFFFFGILLAGGIPVPIYPPIQVDRIEEYVRRQANTLKNAEIRLLITFAKGRILSQLLKSFIPSLNAVLTIEDFKNLPKKTLFSPTTGDDAALIQYTSGSTGDPKGVLLSHQNLLANIRAMGQAIQVKPTDIMVSWLPLYHDMGLIGAWLGSLYYGIPVCIFSPLTFLIRPERWLWAIHYHRGTISGAPNFAYELCANQISGDQIAGLDLSSWRLALNGSESVHATTIRKFAKKFSPYHFNPKAMAPAYGLAESTVALIFPPLNREPKIDQIDRDSFTRQGKAVPTKTDKSRLEIVSCGKPLPAHAVRIVGVDNSLMNEREVGILQFKGPSTMRGYYHNPSATMAAFHDGWCDSGDLAYQVDGEIYITGRKKDIIITAGRNIHPEEIEKIAGNIPGIRQDCVVAFGALDRRSGTEKCIIVAETEVQDAAVRQTLTNDITTQVALALDITPHQVILVNPKTVPKTASGKLQRSACKQTYLQNSLLQPKQPFWLQIGKLFVTGQRAQLWRGLVKLSKVIFTVYAWLVTLITVIPLWVTILGCSHATSSRLISGWAKLILRLIFCPLRVDGSMQDLKNRAMILVSNHASYVDAIALCAAVPIDIIFLAKKELLKMPVLSTFIKKLDCIVVDRLDYLEGVQGAAQTQRVLMQGRSVLIFPEGMFTYATGLRAFKMGAFKLAVDTQIPICPIGIKGTRRLFPANQWLLTPGALTVSIGEPIQPQKHGWEEMARLRDIARLEIAKHCGENTIDLVSAGFVRDI